MRLLKRRVNSTDPQRYVARKITSEFVNLETVQPRPTWGRPNGNRLQFVNF